jgi:CubicO group peptidase (beta-lactamase class C family)
MRLEFLLAVTVLLPVLRAADPVAATADAARIARVETGLLPPAHLAGTPSKPWTITDRMAFYHVPGVSVAVIDRGAIAWARGYGLARAGDPAPVTPDTLFQAGSISKPVTAVAALTLVDAGHLALDADVNDTLTSWKIPAANVADDEHATLRRLLSHTAGVTPLNFRGYANSAPRPTLLQVLDGAPPANSAPIRIDLTPGGKFGYADSGYCVVQQLVLDVSGETFPAFMRTHVLGPAGMDASTCEQPLPAALAPRAAAGHRADGTRIAGDAHVYPEMAAAGLWSTPGDLARFALAMQHSLEGHGPLTRATAMQILQPPLPDSGYGLGFGVKHSGELLQLSHGGGTAGFCCMLVFYPFAGRGAVVMTNSDGGIVLTELILRAIAREYGWPDYEVVEKNAAPLTAGLFDAFAGRYERDDSALRFYRREGHFYLRSADQPRVEIFPQSDHEFFLLDDSTVFAFERNAAGQVTHVIRRSPGGGPQVFRRVE